MIDNSIFENKTAAYYTLGCKLNFAETSAIGQLLSEYGIRKARSGEKADICLINTCTVTELADKKCRQAIRKIAKANPGAFIIATGCYAQLKPNEVAKIEGVDLVLGNDEKDNILRHINNLGQKGTIITSPAKDMHKFIPSCSSDDRTRHFLKVQDGCDYFCSYCTIPMARGRSRNATIASLVRQAEKVAAEGGKEIVLTGVNIGDFGKSTGESFLNLLKALDKVEGIERYRISSIEPNLISGEIIDFVAAARRFMPHFHIPLQSGSDEVLKLMKRRYDTSIFHDKIERIRQLIPDTFIGVDVIVGMRGESDELFEETKRFIESVDVSQLHVFAYSEREGTQALKISHSIPPKVKQERSKALLDISEKKLAAFYNRHSGQQAKVLFEHARRNNNMYGFTENYIKVEAPYNANLVNQITTLSLGNINEENNALTCII
jgi:threonylcarbamoyladenosine tRNA methylthiotransferase MtaB